MPKRQSGLNGREVSHNDCVSFRSWPAALPILPQSTISVAPKVQTEDQAFGSTRRSSTTRWSDMLILERNGTRWLVRDILLKGEWAFKSGESLRTILNSR
jgi:hypothetical protein